MNTRPNAARRLLATAALLTAAVAALTACDPEGDQAATGPATAFTTAAASAPAAPSASHGAPTPTASGHASTAATRAATASARPSAAHSSAAPQADCTAAAQRPGHRVINVTAAAADRLTATGTVFVCGPEVDNDGYYRATGAATGYSFASGASARLVTVSGAVDSAPVSVAALVQHVNDCAADREPAAPYACFGGMYDITTDAAGRITSVTELYHP